MREIKEIDIALSIAGFNFKKKDLETIIKLIEMAGPETTLQQVVTAIDHINDKYEK